MFAVWRRQDTIVYQECMSLLVGQYLLVAGIFGVWYVRAGCIGRRLVGVARCAIATGGVTTCSVRVLTARTVLMFGLLNCDVMCASSDTMYIASCSFGKDSIATILLALDSQLELF